jgi:CHAT domain-containing protein/tetratricopeptide (TPR) repeat protein
VELRRGSCALAGGDLAGAEHHFRDALAIARAEAERFLEVHAAGSLGFVRARAGRYDDATDWFERALVLAAPLEADLLRVKLLGNLGWCAYELGDYEGALSHLVEVEAVAGERGHTGDLQIALQSIGNAHYRRGDLEAAEGYTRRALALARDLAHPRAIAQLLGNLGYFAVAERRFDQAEAYVDEALRIKSRIGDQAGQQHSLLARGQIREGQARPRQAEGLYRGVIGSPHTDVALLWEARAALAGLLVDMDRPSEADAEFRQALAIMEDSRARLSEATHKISFFSSLDRFHERYVDFLVAQGRPEAALEVADRGRARLLREELSGPRPLPAGTARTFRRAARERDAVLLAYWLAPGRSFLWAVTPRGVDLHELPREEVIEDHVERHQDRIQRSRDPLGEESPDADWLFRTLVGPVQASLPAGSRVLVVPDGALHRLNLETLVAPDPDPHYWIEDVTLSNAPSLSILTDRPRVDRPRPPRELLVIGDALSPTDEFPRLAHATTEIQRVAAPFAPPGVTVYSGARAEPAIYRRANPDRYDLIHFAAHASAHRLRPLDSAVILSPRGDEHKLYAREVIDIPVRARLVTLSACRSAGSRTYAGEGLVGLAWAFLGSGARNVVAGLWNVEDSSTADLMGELYRALAQGQAPDRALRAAKLALLRSETAHRKPFYWAPFVVYTRGIGGAAGVEAGAHRAHPPRPPSTAAGLR